MVRKHMCKNPGDLTIWTIGLLKGPRTSLGVFKLRYSEASFDIDLGFIRSPIEVEEIERWPPESSKRTLRHTYCWIQCSGNATIQSRSLDEGPSEYHRGNSWYQSEKPRRQFNNKRSYDNVRSGQLSDGLCSNALATWTSVKEDGQSRLNPHHDLENPPHAFFPRILGALSAVVSREDS